MRRERGDRDCCFHPPTGSDPSGQQFSPVIHTDPGAPVTRTQVGKKIFNPGLGTTVGLTRGVRQNVTIGQDGDSGAPIYKASLGAEFLSWLALCACAGATGAAPSVEVASQAAPSPAATTPSVAPAARTEAEATQPAEAGGTVKIDPTPSCGPSVESDGAASSAAPSHAWLDEPGVREAAATLEQELSAYEAWRLGWYPDHVRHAVVVVFHTDFSAYEDVRQKLERAVAPLPVVLRPACYPRERIDAARQTLERAEWHPRAKAFRMASHLDPSISGFSVTIDSSVPEVAQALEQRLGPLVRVRLGKPHG
jgi:hypothetical protein